VSFLRKDFDMALSNAARQQRFRQRAAYMASLRPRDVLVRACVASGIAALSFLLEGVRPG
jgi:hypothetical protein